MNLLFIATLLLTVLTTTTYAGETIEVEVSLDEICSDEAINVDTEEFCQNLVQELDGEKPIKLEQKDDNGNTWIFNISAGYTRTKYFNSDVHFQNSRINANVDNFDWKERTSFDYFSPEKLKGKGNTFRFLDEPTNAAFLSAKNGKNVVTVSMLHHKYLKQIGQVKHVTGTIDGVEVDRDMMINQIDDYQNDPHDPGQMYLWRFENTWNQTTVQVGYGRELNMLKKGKFSITYTPSVNIGVISGQTYSSYQSQEDYWSSDAVQDKWRIHGMTLSQENRFDAKYKKVGIFVDQKLIVTKVKNKFVDGTATYNLMYVPITVGLTVDINGKKNKTNSPE